MPITYSFFDKVFVIDEPLTVVGICILKSFKTFKSIYISNLSDYSINVNAGDNVL